MAQNNINFEREFPGPNLGFMLELYERYQNDPESVDEAARKLFSDWRPAGPENGSLSASDVHKLVGVVNLAQAIRSYGYLAARLDPLGSPVRNDPILDVEFHKLQPDDLLQISSAAVNLPDHPEMQNASDAIELLRVFLGLEVRFSNVSTVWAVRSVPSDSSS